VTVTRTGHLDRGWSCPGGGYGLTRSVEPVPTGSAVCVVAGKRIFLTPNTHPDPSSPSLSCEPVRYDRGKGRGRWGCFLKKRATWGCSGAIGRPKNAWEREL